MKGAGAAYIFDQISAPLLPRKAKCQWKNRLTVICQIHKSAKWSDGSPLLAKDYVQTFHEFVNPKTMAYRSDLLLPVLNAESILRGDKPVSALGVTARGRTLTIKLQQPDPTFLLALESPLLTPFDASLQKSAGLYRIEKYDAQKIILKANAYYDRRPNRPDLEVSVIYDEAVALKKFELGEIDFLRRVPTAAIDKYEKDPRLRRFRQLRFDSIYLTAELPMDLRRKLASGLNYEELQKIFVAPPRPGCIGIPTSWVGGNICHHFQPTSEKPEPRSLEFWYSKQGGWDFQRLADWLQVSWKKSLNIDLRTSGVEDKIFVDKLKSQSPALFRKGLVPERATCLAVAQTFSSKSPENWGKVRDPEIDRWVEEMRTAAPSTQRQLCQKILTRLLDQAWIIPLGPIDVVTLLSPQWKGAEITELNALNLHDLASVPPARGKSE